MFLKSLFITLFCLLWFSASYAKICGPFVHKSIIYVTNTTNYTLQLISGKNDIGINTVKPGYDNAVKSSIFCLKLNVNYSSIKYRVQIPNSPLTAEVTLSYQIPPAGSAKCQTSINEAGSTVVSASCSTRFYNTEGGGHYHFYFSVIPK